MFITKAGEERTKMGDEEAPKETAETPNVRSGPRWSKAPSLYDLPSERFAFGVHTDILRRFVSSTGNGRSPVSAVSVERNGVPIQAAVLNAGFFRSIGLLERTGKGLYKPTPGALQFVSANSISPERGGQALRPLIEGSWFAEAAKASLSAKPYMPEPDLLGDLASAAQTTFDKKQRSLAVLVDYLVYAGLVQRTERGLALGNGSAPAGGPPHTAQPTGPGSKPPVAAQAPAADDARNWETLQTNEFWVRVRGTEVAIDDCIDFLNLVKKKIKRAAATELPALETH
ncbi:MAG: hypothetical protein L3K11_02665 [Thermoplasmata archaeon]|nr:hypothetical protein [Thermoplasmata archaeon]